MKKRIFIIVSFLLLMFIFVGAGNVFAATTPYLRDKCPNRSSLSGWWASFYPNNRLCSTSYYTYNTVNLTNEQSWYKSGAISLMCGQATPPFGPDWYEDVRSRAYVPSPHSQQTRRAQYYRWYSGQNYLMIGSVNQYNTYGWAWLSTAWWRWAYEWKLSDSTGENLYSKTVDLDAFSVSCPSA